MKHACLVCLFLCLTTTLLSSQSNPVADQSERRASCLRSVRAQADPKAASPDSRNYGKLPLSFEANHGQTDPRVKFLSRTGGYSLFLTGDEAVFALSGKKARH